MGDASAQGDLAPTQWISREKSSHKQAGPNNFSITQCAQRRRTTSTNPTAINQHPGRSSELTVQDVSRTFTRSLELLKEFLEERIADFNLLIA
jgi:hypothetical protein